MSPAVPAHQRGTWFRERYHDAANQVIELLGSEFFGLTGRRVADIGCGDGIIDLGVMHRARPAALVGFDPLPVDPAALCRLAAGNGVPGGLPAGMQFRVCPAESLQAEDSSFDCVFSWAAFHLIADPPAALREIRRVLRPDGMLMLAVYPLFDSQHGSLLQQWYPKGFAQFLDSGPQIAHTVLEAPGPDPEWARTLLERFRSLNRLTVDSLGEVLAGAGLRVVRLQLIAEETRIPPQLKNHPLSRLGTAGVKLLAVPDLPILSD